jgi:hypothetical protein
VYIYNLKHNYICISLLYIYIHDYIHIRKYGTMYLQVCKNWIHIKKTELGGLGEDAAPPKKNEYGTQGVYTGQHASCDHMERMLRQNRDSHGKRGETQIK